MKVSMAAASVDRVTRLVTIFVLLVFEAVVTDCFLLWGIGPFIAAIRSEA